MIKRLLLLLVLLLGTHPLLAQSKTVTGTVTDASDGSPLPGVNVLEEGTTNGTQTDFDGNYSIDAEEGNVLLFSYLGMSPQSVTIGSSNTINVAMSEDASQLEEVVVTALGIARKKKSLTYAAEIVSTGELSTARSVNVLEGLSGKVSGIAITRTGGGIGADSKVLLRGNRSINGNSQPLYVVDGVTMGGDISNISPDDIESMTVLKGANAAALYGSRANNGVIVVTTKLGRAGGKPFAVDVNTTFFAGVPIYLNNFQNEYGQGFDGVYASGANRSWGPRLDGSVVQHWTNNPNFTQTTSYIANPANKTGDFFRTGHNVTTNVGVTTNSDHTNAYFSYTYTDAGGIVPGNDLNSNNLNIRVKTKLTDRFTFDTKLNYIREDTNYALAGGEGYENPIRALYKVPTNIASSDAQQYEFIDNEGLVRQHFWAPNNNAPGNPYWNLNNIGNDLVQERVIGLLSFGYQITPQLNLMVRTSLDRFNSTQEFRWHNDSYIIADNGWFRSNNLKGYEWNTDFLLNYNNNFGEDFSVNANFGGNLRKNQNERLTVNPTRQNSLNVPNLFSLGNTSLVGATEAFSQKEVHSLYGTATFGYKDAIFLDVTGRNDWSSALTKENRSFFYPSVGLTVVASDLMQVPDWISLLKLRGSWAEVGNDTDAFQTVRAANITGGGNNGFLQLATTIPAANLLPESTTSTEIGLDARFFTGRLGLDFTYYKSNSVDQLFRVSLPVASGAENLFVNGADVQNSGVELTLTGSPIRTNDFSWDMTVNFAKNDSKVIEIADELGLEELNIQGASFLKQFKLVKGRPWGDIYSRGFERDAEGRVIVGADGIPTVTNGLDVQVANFNPDWLGGIRNTFTYKNLSLSFLIDIRSGGTIVNNTNAIMFADGQTEETLNGRDGGLIFGENFFAGETAIQVDGSPNTVATNSERMWSALGGRNAPVGEAFVSDASNTRLREMILAYSMPSKILDKTPFTNVRLSLIGRNLFFFSNKAGNVDPEVFSNTNVQEEGTEAFGPPTQRDIGLNLKFGF
jgi:TonB-linked SusC/RagA family outer membrane protein